MKRYALRSALEGGVVWTFLLVAVVTGLVDLDVMEVLVLLAPLSIMPLGFAHLADSASPAPAAQGDRDATGRRGPHGRGLLAGPR